MSDSQSTKNASTTKPSGQQRPTPTTATHHHFAPAIPAIPQLPAPTTLAGRAAATRAPVNAVPTPVAAAAAASAGPNAVSSPADMRGFFAAYAAATSFRVAGGAPPAPPAPLVAPAAPPAAPARPLAAPRIRPQALKANLAIAALSGKLPAPTANASGAPSAAEAVLRAREERDKRAALRASGLSGPAPAGSLGPLGAWSSGAPCTSSGPVAAPGPSGPSGASASPSFGASGACSSGAPGTSSRPVAAPGPSGPSGASASPSFGAPGAWSSGAARTSSRPVAAPGPSGPSGAPASPSFGAPGACSSGARGTSSRPVAAPGPSGPSGPAATASGAACASPRPVAAAGPSGAPASGPSASAASGPSGPAVSASVSGAACASARPVAASGPSGASGASGVPAAFVASVVPRAPLPDFEDDAADVPFCGQKRCLPRGFFASPPPARRPRPAISPHPPPPPSPPPSANGGYWNEVLQAFVFADEDIEMDLDVLMTEAPPLRRSGSSAFARLRRWPRGVRHERRMGAGLPAVYDSTDVNPLLSSRPPPPVSTQSRVNTAGVFENNGIQALVPWLSLFRNAAEVKDSIPAIGRFDHSDTNTTKRKDGRLKCTPAGGAVPVAAVMREAKEVSQWLFRNTIYSTRDDIDNASSSVIAAYATCMQIAKKSLYTMDDVEKSLYTMNDGSSTRGRLLSGSTATVVGKLDSRLQQKKKIKEQEKKVIRQTTIVTGMQSKTIYHFRSGWRGTKQAAIFPGIFGTEVSRWVFRNTNYSIRDDFGKGALLVIAIYITCIQIVEKSLYTVDDGFSTRG
ncbi:hypothetical protein BCR43DRAFT_515679 [Syncephalastrum racemosum]|uniref:Uncharacterized protein n=1 Tax=Syncephalastrum racemosum TaxID=13706 RepID=A0A1X2HA93_SYNRA|nr:hypothetical protein BCR43DRAFT_515679 [Syncephalastrum racemosum]